MRKGAEASIYRPVPVSRRFLLLLSAIHFSTFLGIGFLVTTFTSPSIPIYFIPINGYITEVLAMLTHWMGHRPWLFWWYDAHMDHHLVQYPLSKFLRPQYQGAKKDNSTAYFFAIIASPYLSCAMSKLQCTVTTYLIGLIVSTGLLLLADYLHKEFHIQNSALSRFEWFRQLQSLHWFHHAGNMKSNYAIGDFWFDWLILGLRRNNRS